MHPGKTTQLGFPTYGTPNSKYFVGSNRLSVPAAAEDHSEIALSSGYRCGCGYYEFRIIDSSLRKRAEIPHLMPCALQMQSNNLFDWKAGMVRAKGDRCERS
jgi:hypothetical protein